jgi:hypothetical protein
VRAGPPRGLRPVERVGSEPASARSRSAFDRWTGRPALPNSGSFTRAAGPFDVMDLVNLLIEVASRKAA